ncbi:MAG TPA: hypothetical protein VMU80_04280 [Bryobacteraceae bacterium]|nr:hypothetical protein [Bryobacteraceae bacterium]
MAQTNKQDRELLEAALIGFQRMREQLDQKIADLSGQLNGRAVSHPASVSTPVGAAPLRRTMSASARRRIALAQKKRWAAYKAGQTKTTVAKPRKRVLSAAGRARIAAATKKRWAAFRKAKESNKTS